MEKFYSFLAFVLNENCLVIPAVTRAVLRQRWKTDRFLVPFRPGALFSVASYPRPDLSP